MNSRFMRIVVMFDLPVAKKRHRKEYAQFRKFLVNDGYDMMQYSIYVRLCKGLDGVNKHKTKLSQNLPQWGVVRAITMTEKQFADMDFLVGAPRELEEAREPTQLAIF